MKKKENIFKTEFIEEGRNFKQNQTIQNFEKFEALKIHPYLIQNLIVFSFICIKSIKKREFFKGRFDQILTDEGKSLIISEIALISALKRDFVNIIPLITYLASRESTIF